MLLLYTFIWLYVTYKYPHTFNQFSFSLFPSLIIKQDAANVGSFSRIFFRVIVFNTIPITAQFSVIQVSWLEACLLLPLHNSIFGCLVQDILSAVCLSMQYLT
jgi:hypothetical protein